MYSHIKISVQNYKNLKSVNILEEKCTLDKLPLDIDAVVISVECKENIINRIFDFGIIENSVIRPVFKSPFGNPTAYLIKNSVVALREKDSKNITVSPIK